MKKIFQTNYLFTLPFLVIPLFSFAQNFENEPNSIDPPPAPIDDYLIPFVFVAILIAAFYFYKTNFKMESK